MALAVSFLYACAVGAENYRTHLNEGDFGISIHPRYFYPISALLGVVVFTPLFRVATSGRARWAFLAAIAARQLLRGPVEPLDLGRRRRLASSGQWRALLAR